MGFVDQSRALVQYDVSYTWYYFAIVSITITIDWVISDGFITSQVGTASSVHFYRLVQVYNN